MLYATRMPDEARPTIDRCYLDADLGDSQAAIERLTELQAQLSDDPHVLYAAGDVTLRYSGRGREARDLFQRAFDLSLRLGKDSTAWFAACNATLLQTDTEATRRYADWVTRNAPADNKDRATFQQILGASASFGERIPLAHVLGRSQVYAEAGHPGTAAAILAVADEAEGAEPEEYARSSRLRAGLLRELDKAAENAHEARGLRFIPEDRLALRDAVASIDIFLAHDPYDAEAWNFRSAWCCLLERHMEALEAAQRALDLRPHDYHRPHMNRAVALRALGRVEEAIAAAAEAERVASEAGMSADAVQASNFAAEWRRVPRRRPDHEIVAGIMRGVDGARRVSDRAMSSTRGVSVTSLTALTLEHGRLLGLSALEDFAPFVAQMLADFTPETVFEVMRSVATKDTNVVDGLILGAIHLVIRADDPQKRDASRLLAWFIVAFPTMPAIRAYYRQGFLAPAALPGGGCEALPDTVRPSLARFGEDVPGALNDQSPLTAAEIETARRNVVAWVVRTPTRGLPGAGYSPPATNETTTTSQVAEDSQLPWVIRLLSVLAALFLGFAFLRSCQ